MDQALKSGVFGFTVIHPLTWNDLLFAHGHLVILYVRVGTSSSYTHDTYFFLPVNLPRLLGYPHVRLDR